MQCWPSNCRGSLIVEETPISVSEQSSQGTFALSLQADQRQLSMPIQLLALSSAMTLVKARKSLLTPGLQRGSLCQYRGSEGECERAAYYGCGKGLKSVLFGAASTDSQATWTGGMEYKLWGWGFAV